MGNRNNTKRDFKADPIRNVVRVDERELSKKELIRANTVEHKHHEKSFFTKVTPEIENVDLYDSINKIKDIDQEGTEESDFEEVDNPSIIIDQGIVYIEGFSKDKVKIRRNIGISNIKTYNVIPLIHDPCSVTDESIDLATSALGPKLRSSSPSMMYHQSASIALIKSFIWECRFEEPSTYTPDITVEIPDANDRFFIDITSDNLISKFNSLRNNKVLNLGKFLIISKYSILKSKSEVSKSLRFMSRRNDSMDVEFAYSKAEKHAIHCNQEMSYSKNLIRFFVNQRDDHGRTLDFHSEVARKAFHRILDEKEEEPKPLPDLKREFSDLAEYMNSKTEVRKTRNNESDFFIFPKIEGEPVYIGDKVFNVKLAGRSGLMTLDKGGIPTDKNYYEIIEGDLRVPLAMMSANVNYKRDKIKNEINDIPLMKHLLEKYRNADIAYARAVVMKRIESHTNYKFDDDGNITFKPRDLLPNKRLKASIRLISDKITNSSLYCPERKLDPEHFDLINRMNMVEMGSYLRHLRDYHELRFKRKLATAIQQVRSPDKLVKVINPEDRTQHCEFLIRGLIFEKDKGVVIISYFTENMLYRTELWRLTDVENFTVAVDRLVSCACGLFSRIQGDQFKRAITLYARILSENSWGAAKALKSYRYLATGVCLSSPLIREQISEFKKCLNDSTSSKLSFYLMQKYFDNVSYGKTPMFSLDFADLSYEIFLMSLTPVYQYGVKKHLKDSMSDLYKELELYDNSNSKSLIRSFEDKILSVDGNLLEQYYSYFKDIESFSETTGKRFTWTPAANVLLYTEIKKIEIQPSRIQETVPLLSELLTLKASHSTNPPTSGKAVESISVMSEKYGTKSISLLSSMILNKRGIVDLGMRMFGKNDDYMNREISILSAEYRIIQYIPETFFKNFNKSMPDVTVNSKDKRRDLYKDQEILLEHDRYVSLILDQKKWGPNNNTINFALIAASLVNKTTEAYLPMIYLLMMEFKCFEVPPWLTNFYSKINCSYGVVGSVGRSHMGLGICQNSSSTYCCLMLRLFHTMFRERVNKYKRIENLSIYTSSYGESDDGSCALGITCQKSYSKVNGIEVLTSDPEDELVAEVVKKEYVKMGVNIGNFFLFLGTLTSSYKNIVSENFREYCSIYCSRENIARTDLKFLYSLITPQTTGNFLQDLMKVYDSFSDAINSGCSFKSSEAISLINYYKFCRQWKTDFRNIGVPDLETLQTGLPRIRRINEHPFFSFKTRNHLKFNLRDRYTVPEYSKTIDKLLTEIKMDQIARSRESTAYRSIITYGDAKKDMIATATDYYKEFGCFGETCESYLYHTVRDKNHVRNCIREELDQVIEVDLSSVDSKGNRFRSMRLKKNLNIKSNIFSLVSNSYDPVPLVNFETSDEKLLLHVMRNTRTGEIPDKTMVNKLDLLGRIVYFSNLIEEEQEKAGNVTHWYNSSSLEPDSYTRLTYLTAEIINVDSSFKTMCCKKYIPPLKYISNLDSKIYRLSMGNMLFRCNYMQGNSKFDKELIEERFTEPTDADIIAYLDTRVFEENTAYVEDVLRGSHCYVNILIDSERKDSELPIIEKRDKEITPDMLAEIFTDNELDGILTKVIKGQENNKDDEENDDFEGFFDGILEGKIFISAKVSPEFLIFTGNYMRSRVIKNYYINRLIESGGVRASYSPQKGYLLHEILGSEEKNIWCFDPQLSTKLNNSLSHVELKFRNKINYVQSDWLALAKLSVSEYSRHMVMNFSSCFLYSDQRIIFSREPMGTLVSKFSMIKEINALETTII